jgi:hypothetical protein
VCPACVAVQCHLPHSVRFIFQSKRAGTPAPYRHSKIVRINHKIARLEHPVQILSLQVKTREVGNDAIYIYGLPISVCDQVMLLGNRGHVSHKVCDTGSSLICYQSFLQFLSPRFDADDLKALFLTSLKPRARKLY